MEQKSIVDIALYYSAFLLGYALFTVPIEMVSAFGALWLLVAIIVLFFKRRSLKKILPDDDLSLNHLNNMGQLFWRFSYLGIACLVIASMIIGVFGNNDAEVLLGANPGELEYMQYIAQYNMDNKSLILWVNFLCFLPLMIYMLAKHYIGYKAFHAEKLVDIKIWSI